MQYVKEIIIDLTQVDRFDNALISDETPANLCKKQLEFVCLLSYKSKFFYCLPIASYIFRSAYA